jgi:hypothetical protein
VVTGLLPELEGAAHETVAVALPGVAVTPVGAPGGALVLNTTSTQ